MRRLEIGDWSRLLGSYACCCNRRHVATKLKYNQKMGEVKRNDFISAREAAATRRDQHITHTPRVPQTQITLLRTNEVNREF